MTVAGRPDRVEELARKIAVEEGVDMEEARLVAEQQLIDSEIRTQDPQAGDPREPEVIHRTSEETASDLE